MVYFHNLNINRTKNEKEELKIVEENNIVLQHYWPQFSKMCF